MVQPIENWREDVTAEKDIFSAFAVSARDTFHKGDVTISSLIVVISFGLFLFGEFGLDLVEEPRVVSKFFAGIANSGLSFSATMLGFIVAVYSLFAALLPTEIFDKLARFKYERRAVSEFKYVNYSFLNIFLYYIMYMAFSWIAAAVFAENGPLYALLSLRDGSPLVSKLILGFLISLYAGASVLALFLIKTLVWNMYQARLLTILVPRDEGRSDKSS